MSILFTSINLGQAQIKNRFIHSATHEVMASETGEVSDKLVTRYQHLAKRATPPVETKLPFRFIGILDVTSKEEWMKDTGGRSVCDCG